ncbi:hypothetical protein [Luteimonas deserti]|uniref:Type IV pilus biogenesis protein PilP n=1 Tax=Luteimonas deserti TaxID=2752306 RepID=A0A7Z0U0R8_9GAMM|nr:hypothetical protein [Luteimonas deserti]NYZ63563.1 hypothetical protein [Luteimonas deserti]
MRQAPESTCSYLWIPPLAALALWTGVAHADAGHPCAATPEPASRLACYDLAFPPPAEVREASAARAVQEFGLPRASPVLRNPGQPDEEADPTRIEGRVSQVVQEGGRRVVVFDGGQRWAIEPGAIAPLKSGDVVEVRRGALGSHLLKTAGGVSLRARRLP